MNLTVLDRCQSCNLYNRKKCSGCTPSTLKCEQVQKRLAERKENGIGLENESSICTPHRADFIRQSKCEPMKRKEEER